jgi:adenine-specific DNA-methyltransferase
MHLPDYHAKYFAHKLTKRCASDSLEKLAEALVDAQVDLNPHKSKPLILSYLGVYYHFKDSKEARQRHELPS